jgi:hypothetical protein
VSPPPQTPSSDTATAASDGGHGLLRLTGGTFRERVLRHPRHAEAAAAAAAAEVSTSYWTSGTSGRAQLQPLVTLLMIEGAPGQCQPCDDLAGLLVSLKRVLERVPGEGAQHIQLARIDKVHEVT